MTSAALHHPAARTGHTRVSDAAWDGFDSPRRNRRAARGVAVAAKARIARAHITFAETPDFYLREEMS